jgi:hypothetical protein
LLVSALNPSPTPTPNPSPSYLYVEEQITVKGKVVCLPHKKSEGPQTLECAYGLHADSGDYYGLDTIFYPDPMAIPNIPMDTSVTMTGLLKLATDENELAKIYDVKGNIAVQTIEQNE